MLNIPSIYGGISLWGEGNRHKSRKMPLNFPRKDSYVLSEGIFIIDLKYIFYFKGIFYEFNVRYDIRFTR